MSRSNLSRIVRALALLALLLGGNLALAAAAPAAPVPLEWLTHPGNSPEMSSALRVFLLLTALSFIPAAVICMTCFMRIVIVVSMLRHAIGLAETPPNIVVIMLSLFLTLFAMQPVIEKVNAAAFQPYRNGKASLVDAAVQAKEPVKEFLVRQTREADLMLMIDVALAPQPGSIADISMVHLVPAYMLSELRVAFQIGFTIFLPFLLVDLVVASALMALGMMMVPPSTISIPLKLLLFVLIDGWHIVAKALLGSVHV